MGPTLSTVHMVPAPLLAPLAGRQALRCWGQRGGRLLSFSSTGAAACDGGAVLVYRLCARRLEERACVRRQGRWGLGA